MREADEHRPAAGRFGRFFAALGPGLISGAADDDPTSVGTYSVVGAQFATFLRYLERRSSHQFLSRT